MICAYNNNIHIMWNVSLEKFNILREFALYNNIINYNRSRSKIIKVHRCHTTHAAIRHSQYKHMVNYKPHNNIIVIFI